MTKKQREQIKQKFGGLCAYSGKPLDDKWQVDHVTPKSHWNWYQPSTVELPNDENNLIPCLRILNHYKRGKTLEEWRSYLLTLHLRINKLPKTVRVERSQKRKEYLLQVAEVFGITPTTPFNGNFFFEQYNQ